MEAMSDRRFRYFWSNCMDLLDYTVMYLTNNIEWNLILRAVVSNRIKGNCYHYAAVPVVRAASFRCSKPFWFAYPLFYNNAVRVLKFAEGAYGECFKFHEGREQHVLKLIPLNGFNQRLGISYMNVQQVQSDIFCSLLLDRLRVDGEYYSSAFPKIYKIGLLQAPVADALVYAQMQYRRPTNHNRFHILGNDKIFVAIDMEYGGQALDQFIVPRPEIADSILNQLITGLAIAEDCYHFEHRDLTTRNILVARTSKKRMKYVFQGSTRFLHTEGVKVKVIDFSYSRIRYEDSIKYTVPVTLLNADPNDDNFYIDTYHCYFKMREAVGNSWRKFSPKTNIIYLQHIAEKLLLKVRELDVYEEEDLANLTDLAEHILEFDSARDLFLNKIF